MNDNMDSTHEFRSLVDAHRRLARKYSSRQNWIHNPVVPRMDDGQDHFQHPSFVNESSWRDNAYPLLVPGGYPALKNREVHCCPRCNCVSETTPRESLPARRESIDRQQMQFNEMGPDNGLSVHHLLYLQEASMEYARLLNALNAGNAGANASQAGHLMTPYPCDSETHDFTRRVGNLVAKRKCGAPESEATTIAVKRTRLVWTKELHERFVQAIEKIGVDKAVPKLILEVMGVEGLTRENVASHLQKYRLQLGRPPSDKGDLHCGKKLEVVSQCTHGITESESASSCVLSSNSPPTPV